MTDPAVGHDDLVRNADVAMYTAKSGERSLRGLRAGHAQRRAQPPAVEGRSAARPSTTTSSCSHFQPIMSVDDGQMTAGRHSCVGTAQSGARPTERVHPAVRGDRADPATRPVGARRSVAPRRTMVVRRAVADDERQPVGDAAPAAERRLRGGRRRWPSPCSPADVLTLEVTESMLISDVDASVATLHELRALGRPRSSSTTSGPGTPRSATCASSRSRA